MAKEQLKERDLSQMDETYFIKTGDVGLDLAFGGFPQGAMVEIYGNNSSGKTTLCFEAAYKFLQEFQTKNVYYYNYERSIDKFYVRNLLKNDESLLKRFKIVDPEFLEDGMNHLLEVMEADIASLCIVDSLAAMQPKSEAEKALDKAQVGGFKAKAMAEVCRKIGSALAKGSKTCVVWINHVNPKLDSTFSFIKQEETPGGKAVKFWASLRLELTVMERLTKEEVVVGSTKKEKIPYGNVVKVKVEKNKFYPPFKRAVCYIIYGRGLDRARSLVDYALQIGLVVKKNSLDYCLKGKESNAVRGIQNFSAAVAKNQKAYNYLYSKVVAFIEEKRQEILNPNLESFKTTDPSYLLNNESEEKEEETSTDRMFSELISQEDSVEEEDDLNDLNQMDEEDL